MSATATHATFITAEKPTAVTRIAEALDRSIGMDAIERDKASRTEVLIKSTELLMSMLNEARGHQAAIGRDDSGKVPGLQDGGFKSPAFQED